MHESEFTNEHSTIVKVENEANAKLMDLRAPHVQCAKENENKKSSEVELNIGTDCSGLEAPLFALRNIGVNHRLKFSCDNDPEVRKNHEANFTPEVFYPDIKTRQTSDMPTVDIYVAGFPCQPFSEAGKKEGFEDSKGRGTIFYRILEYIQEKIPKVFILENVKGIIKRDQGKLLKKIMKLLNKVKTADGQ
jgi:DNA-cytosine methyltransferase